MQLTAQLHSRLRHRTSDPHRRRNTRSIDPPRRNAVLQTLARAKRSGGPEDRALYSCSCGYAFEADVSTSVGCPHCGSSQAW